MRFWVSLMPDTHRTVLFALLIAVSLVGGAAVPASAGHDGGDCTFPVSSTDATGTEVTVDAEPGSIVTLDAASAQTMWELDTEGRVEGMPVRSYTEYLEGSESRTDVLSEDGRSVDTETVIELDPDLVLAPNFTPPETIEQLRDAGLTVYQSEFESSFEDIYAKTELYGHFVGECEAADERVAEMQDDVETVRETVADRERPRVLYYFFGTAAGNGTFIGDIVETAGGENVAATAGVDGYQQISDETIAEADPEWIVTTDNDASIDTTREPLASTTAVKNDQVLEVDANLVSQAAPRVTEPLLAMAEAFHPEAFAEATAAETPTATEASMEETDAATATATEDPADGDGAGFGVVAALVALLSAALVGRLN